MKHYEVFYTYAFYSTKKQPSYAADIQLTDGILTITEGDRPIANGVQSSLEIRLPEQYDSELLVHATNGGISLEAELTLTRFQADTTNGEIQLSNLTAEDMVLCSTDGTMFLQNLVAERCTIQTTNGDVFLDGIEGYMDYCSKGGALDPRDASGFGQFLATGDGALQLSFMKVTGNLAASTKNGALTVTIPQTLNFLFSANTQEGHIQTPFSSVLSIDENAVSGTIGQSPQFSIDLESRNGEIEVLVQ